MVKADEVGLLVGADESKSMAVVEDLLLLLGFSISRVFFFLGVLVCLWVK